MFLMITKDCTERLFVVALSIGLIIPRLDFRRLPGPVLILLRGDECGLIFPNSGW